MQKYPTVFPSDAVGIIASSISKPTAATAEAAWNVAGYALGVTLGETVSAMPVAQAGVMLSTVPPTDSEAIEALTQFANAHGNGSDPKLMGSFNFPFTAQQILTWALGVIQQVIMANITK